MENPHQNNSPRVTIKFIQTTIVGLGLISGLIYLFNFKLQRLFYGFDLISKSGIHFYLFLFLVLSVFYGLGVFLIFKHLPHYGRSKSLLFTILAFALAFRACLVPADPSVLSKDLYRYIWDGRVQQKGINPYLYPPAANELKDLRDDKVYPNINRKSYPTLYPAGSQLFFHLLHIAVGDSVFGFKGLMTFFDGLTLFALLGLLRVSGFEETRLIIYAWNPLAIFEIAYSGHLEGITVFLMVLALYLNATNQKMFAVICLAASSATKLYPALLLPVLLNPGQRIRGILTFAGSVGLLYLPFLTAGSKVLGFLPIYLQNPYESFNLGLKHLMLRLFPPLNYYMLSKLFLLLLMVTAVVIFFKDKQKTEGIRYAYILMGLFIVLMPASLHAWYVVILIPFLCFYPNVAWLFFSCAVTLSYLKYVTSSGIMPTWILMLEYIPLFTLLAAGYILKKHAHKNCALHTKKPLI
jgi:alpha-1,6-mannosyltransferase